MGGNSSIEMIGWIAFGLGAYALIVLFVIAVGRAAAISERSERAVFGAWLASRDRGDVFARRRRSRALKTA